MALHLVDSRSHCLSYRFHYVLLSRRRDEQYGRVPVHEVQQPKVSKVVALSNSSNTPTSWSCLHLLRRSSNSWNKQKHLEIKENEQNGIMQSKVTDLGHQKHRRCTSIQKRTCRYQHRKSTLWYHVAVQEGIIQGWWIRSLGRRKSQSDTAGSCITFGYCQQCQSCRSSKIN